MTIATQPSNSQNKVACNDTSISTARGSDFSSTNPETSIILGMFESFSISNSEVSLVDLETITRPTFTIKSSKSDDKKSEGKIQLTPKERKQLFQTNKPAYLKLVSKKFFVLEAEHTELFVSN